LVELWATKDHESYTFRKKSALPEKEGLLKVDREIMKDRFHREKVSVLN